MLQILNWLCLISLTFLSFQVFSYMCKDTIKLYKNIVKPKKNYNLKPTVSKDAQELLNKIAK